MNIHDKFVYHGKHAKKHINECKMLLPEIDRDRIWEQKGYGSIYEYAAKLACLSRGQVDDALRIMRRIEDKPELIEVARVKSINAVRPVAAIATKEDAGEWAEKAAKISKHTLELHVRESRTGTEKQANTIEMELSQEIEDELKTLKGSGDWETLMRELLEARKKLHEQEKPQKVENAKRYMPKAIEKWVIKTTNGQCSKPGCYKPYYALHHKDPFSENHVHDPDRIELVCKEHHELEHQSESFVDKMFRNYMFEGVASSF
ncbi:HNH endonuclease signature motif containing protein [Patescibacteria group bacterium]